ncbi:MAG TPA: PD-(D/E)XK nuclease family protein [Tepidisphaeraceae bacterium]
MAVRFIVGRSGSGKSLHCFRSIVDMMRADPLGAPIYWIVPKQETFTIERELTCASGLNGFCRTHVVSFDLLGEEILAECGGTAIPQITDLGRQMVIGHLLRQFQSKLSYYKSTARQVGLAAELDATFSELERSGRRVEDLSAVIDEFQSTTESPDSAPFLNKLRDLRLLYAQYTLYLGQDRIDPHRRLEQVLAAVEDCKRVQGSTIFVDDFLEFSDPERRMLVGLANVARDLRITLLLDPTSTILNDAHYMPDGMGLFHRTEDAYRRLWFAFNEAGIAVDPPQALSKVSRFINPSLRHIEQHAFSPGFQVSRSGEGIEMIEAPDRRAEVDAAARQVRGLIESGMRFRDIAVLMRDLNDYHELIDASFREHDIPYFVDRRRPAAHHPLIQFTRSVLQIALHNWPHDAVMTLLKTELAGLTLDEADELENYVLLHRIRGSAWADARPWSYRRRLTRAEDDEPSPAELVDLKRIDTMRRRVVDGVQPLVNVLASGNVSVREVVVALFEVFERFRVRATLKAWMKQAREARRFEEQEEHAQVWRELADLLDQMVDVIGAERLAPCDFESVLDTGLERFDLALTPPTMDQVLIGAVDRTRGARPKAVVLLGMNDNQFPRVPREDSILSDGERQTLRQQHLDLDPDSERSLFDERLLGYLALTRASEQLCLIRSVADDENRPQSPSPFWVRVREMFPSIVPTQIPRDSRSRIDLIGTPRQLVTSLMQWVRTSPRHGAPRPFESLYQWLATRPWSDDPIDVMRYRAWRALSYVNEARLSPQTSAELFKSPLGASVSRIEAFAACPFKHFLTYGLGLSGREDPDVTALDLGNVCHGILEKIVKHIVAQKGGAKWDAIPPAKLRPLIQALATEIGQDLRGELLLSTARNQYILGRIEKTIEHVMASQCCAGKRGKLTPWRAELTFGIDDKGLPPLILKTPGGNEIRLRGKIDRVDRLENSAQFAVVDYKLSGRTLALDEVYHGLSLQLLTYLLVLQRNGEQLADKPLTPVAAFYVRLLRQLESVKHPDEATDPSDPAFDLKVKPRGLIDIAHRRLLDASHSARDSEVVQIALKADGTLGYKDRSDGCETAEFAAMLGLVERKLTELADQIIAGRIDVHPYQKGKRSACVTCEYHSVCRFDVPPNHYKPIRSIPRAEVLKRALEGGT